MLSSPRSALAAFVVIIFHSVLDSSDGQLARMTGQSYRVRPDAGRRRRLPDAHARSTSAIARAGACDGERRGDRRRCARSPAVSNIVHAQMYDYHRSAYCARRRQGRRARRRAGPRERHRAAAYEAMQRALAGRAPGASKRRSRARAAAGVVRRRGSRALSRHVSTGRCAAGICSATTRASTRSACSPGSSISTGSLRSSWCR